MVRFLIPAADRSTHTVSAGRGLYKSHFQEVGMLEGFNLLLVHEIGTTAYGRLVVHGLILLVYSFLWLYNDVLFGGPVVLEL